MTLVFTNGVFDLIHVGHVRLLCFAKSLGDKLVVGINSDASVARLKGPSRPIIPLVERIETLMAFKAVDNVIPFDEDTPNVLITALHPDILVKGSDYKGRHISGAAFVRSYGGRVEIPDWPVTVSTTSIIERIQQCS